MTAPASPCPCARVPSSDQTRGSTPGWRPRGDLGVPKPGMWGDRTGVTPPQCLPLQRCPCQLRARGGRSALGTHPRHPLRPRHPSLPCQASIWHGALGNNECSQLLPRPGGGTRSCPCRTRGAAPPGYVLGVLGPAPAPARGVECPLFALAPPPLPHRCQGRALGGFCGPSLALLRAQQTARVALGSWSGPSLALPAGIP